MASTDQLATRVRRILAGALPSSVLVHVVPRSQEEAPAFDVIIEAGATSHRFVAGWAGEGWPGDAEELARHVPTIEVAVARKLSDSAKAWLAGRGIGWIDESGDANITRSSGLVLVRDSVRASTSSVRPPRWSGSTLAVAEAVISGITPTVERIETATSMSRNATATGLARLERLGYLDRPEASRGPRSGRRVVDSESLLDGYAAAAAEQRSKQPLVRAHRLWVGDPMRTLRSEIAPALSGSKHRWAVTGVAAAQLIAPYLTEVTTLDLYVDADLMANPGHLATRLGARIVDRGHVIEVRELPTVMTERGPFVDGVRVALPARVYADLRAAGGRWAEAAAHLREEFRAGTAA